MRHNHSVILSATSALILALALVGCRSSSTASKATEFAREQTLYIGGVQWGEPTSFNPLLDQASWPCKMPTILVYETLLTYDPNRGQMVPALAESHQVTADGIELTLNKQARWNDGKPVTAWDVHFSFGLGQKYKNVPTSPLWEYLEAVRVLDAPQGAEPPLDGAIGADYPRKVFFAFNKQRQNPLVVLDALQSVYVIPRHVLLPALQAVNNNIHEFLKLKLDKDPVASGPYKLLSYSGEKVIVVRDDDSWGNAALFGGKQPAPKYLIHMIYKSNDHYSIGLQQGRLDATSSFIPRIWLKHRKQVRSWFDEDPFYPSSSIPMLFINVTRPPLDDTRLRRAMAFAINYKDIRELAVSGYSPPLKPGLVLPFGTEAKYYSAQDAARYGVSYNPERAKQILKGAGYRSIFDSAGKLQEMRDPKGQKVRTIEITSPAGWTDWESVVRIAVKSLRAVGVDARERFVDGNVYWPSLPKGEFDLLMQTPVPEATPSQPWTRFDFLMTSDGWAPVGDKMYKNYGRFNNPKAPGYLRRVDELLNQIPALTDETERIRAYRELNQIFMQQQPTIPLVYRPEQFFQYSVRHWKNFPSGKNPYSPAFLPGYRFGTRMLWSLEPAAAD